MTTAAAVHYGHFDNTGTKKYAIEVDGALLTSEDGWGHDRLRTFRTKAGAEKVAKTL